MTTFIIVCLTAIAIELGRRYFINEKLSGVPLTWWQAIPALLLIATLVASWYNHDWFWTICWFIAVLIDILLIGLTVDKDSKSKEYKEKANKDDKLTGRDKLQLAAFLSSWFIPLALIIPITVSGIKRDTRDFEAKWQELKPLIIQGRPLKVAIDGGRNVVLGFTNSSDDLLFDVQTYGDDILKLTEGDQIKYLEIHYGLGILGRHERFQIVTLQGKPNLVPIIKNYP